MWWGLNMLLITGILNYATSVIQPLIRFTVTCLIYVITHMYTPALQDINTLCNKWEPIRDLHYDIFRGFP